MLGCPPASRHLDDQPCDRGRDLKSRKPRCRHHRAAAQPPCCLPCHLPRSAGAPRLIVLVLSSDPSAAFVAPFGGKTPVLTPNPIAAGIPADPDPVILD